MLRRAVAAGFAAALTVVCAFSTLAPPAAAAPGGKPTTTEPPASIVLNESEPRLGGTVTFTLTYSKRIKGARYAVRCYQDGRMTYAEARAEGEALLLGGGGSEWLTNGGAASCTAELFYFVWNGTNPQEYHSLAWTSFEAAG